MPKSPQSQGEARSFLPLRPEDFQILLVLAEEDLHGYGIMKAVAEQSRGNVELGLGSLYRRLARLVQSGLLAAVEAPDDSLHSEDRRKMYRLTSLGCRAARAEARRLTTLLQGKRVRRLLATAPDAEGS